MSSKRPWTKREPKTRPVVLRRWLEVQSESRCSGRPYRTKIGDYHVHHCSCGSRFHVHDAQHRLGLDATGVTLEPGEKSGA